MILRSIPRARRMASYRGRLMVDTVRGVLRVRKWPKKRGTPKSALQRFWIDWFKQANLLAKYADGLSQANAIAITKGTGLYPRDVLLSAMRGRLYWWVDETGWKWFPMAAILDVANSLEVLGQEIGQVLVRGVDRWRSTAAGSSGDVLTHQGPADAPAWQVPAAGGPPFGGALASVLANQSIPNAAWTALKFDTEQYDTDTLHDNVVNNSRMTVPAGWPRVRMVCGVQWANSSVNTRHLTIWKNGAAFVGRPTHRQKAWQTNEDTVASPVVAVSPGDYFEAMVFQDRGSALNVLGPSKAVFFSMEKVV